MGNFYYNLVQFDANGALNGLGFRIQLNDFTEATTADGGSMASMLVTYPFTTTYDNGDISVTAGQYMVFNDPVIETPSAEDIANGYDWADWKFIGEFPNGQKMMVFVTAEDGRDSHLHDAHNIIFSSDYSQVLHAYGGLGNGYAGFGWFDDSARVIGTSEALNTEVENGSYTIPEGPPVVGKRLVVKLPSLVVDAFPTEAVANLYDGSGTLVASAINSATSGQPHLFVFGTAASPLPNVHVTEGSDLVGGHYIFIGDTYGDGLTDGGSAGLIEVYLRDENDVEVLAGTVDMNAAAVSYLDTDASPGVYFNIDVVGEAVTLGTLASPEADLSGSAPAAPSYRTRVHGPDQVDMKLVSDAGDEYKTMTEAKAAGLPFGSAISPMLELAYSAIDMSVSDYDGALSFTPVNLGKLNAVADEVTDLLSADLAALQADVDQNEADSDAAHAAATTDRAAIRSEFAAADLALSGALTSTISALQADVDQNELDGDTDRAAIRSEFAAADEALETAMLAAIAAVQADVDQNEADSDAAHSAATTDRAAIRSEVEVIRAALQADVDQNEADADAAIAAEEAARIAADNALTASLNTEISDRISAVADEAAARLEGDQTLQSNIDALSSMVMAGVDWKAPVETVADMVALLGDESGNFKSGDVRVIKSEMDAFLYVGTGGEDLTSLDASFGTKFIRFMDSSEILAGIQVVQTAVDNEVARAQLAEGQLDDAIGAETQRALGQEAAIRSEFAAADTALQTSLQAAIDAVQADVDQNEADSDAAHSAATADRAAIRSEFAAADEALETAMMAAIEAEETRALAAEAAIQADVDANEAAALQARTELSAAYQAADAALQAEMDQSQLSLGLEADGTYVADAAATYISGATSMKGADSLLDAAIVALQADVDQNEAKSDALILAEEQRALAAEAAIQADVDANEAAATAGLNAATVDRAAIRSEFAAADATLQSSIDALQADVNQNEADADAAIAALQADIDQNEADADAAIAALQADVDQNEADADAAIANLQSQVDFIVSNTDPAAIDSLTEMLAAFQAGDSDLLAAINALESKHDTEMAALQADVDQNEADSDAAHAAATTDRAAIRSEFAAADEALETAMLAAIAVVQADVDQNEADADAAIAAEETARLAGDAAAAADRAILRTDLLLLQDRDRTQNLPLLPSDFAPGTVVNLDEPASHVPFVFVNGVMIRPADSANGIDGDYTLNSDANGNFESISFGIPLYQGDAIIIKYLKAVVLS